MKKSLVAVALAFCASAWAVDTARVTALDGVTTADYASLQAALDACTGGETVTMLTDETMTSQVRITKSVTLDLAGHTITMSKYSDFLSFSSNLTATICGGTVDVRTERSLITVKEGTTVNVTNCTLKGYCMFYGNHTTGRMNVMADTVALVDYPISGYSPAEVTIHDGYFAIAQGWKQGSNTMFPGNLHITGGCFTRDPSFSDMLDGSVYGVKGVSETRAGTTFTCQVVPKGEITNCARVTTSGGASTDYATIQAALDACAGGETVTMLASVDSSSYIQIKKSITFDLAGLTFRHLTSNSIRSDSGTTVTIQNGKVIGASSQSTFAPSQGSVMNVTNCTVTGNCLVWSSGTGKLNILSDSFVNVTHLGSGNGKAALEVRGGYINYTNLRDKNVVGTTFQFFGGYFTKLSTESLAEGCRYLFSGTTKNFITFTYRVMSSEEIAAFGGLEAEIGVVGFRYIQAAFQQVKAGETIYMVKDVATSIQQVSKVGSNFTFDLGGHCLSGNLDIFRVYTNSTVRLRNGTIRETEGAKSCFQMYKGATLIVESTARIEGASGKTTNCLHMPFENARVVFDGAQIATVALYSWSSENNSTIEITGDSVMTCSRFAYSGTPSRLPPRVVATGGSFAINPTSYVTNNHVVLYRANTTPCKWQVKPWAAICSDGWTFNLPMEAATVTGTCAAPPAGPITVSLAGTIPTRKTLLADLSGLTFSSGEYGDLSFVRNASLPASIQVSYENGKLYAWEMKGTMIVFK